MEFALTRKQLNKKRAEAAAGNGAPLPGADGRDAGTAGVAGSDPFVHGTGMPQGLGSAPVGDGVPPLLPEGFGRPAVGVLPDAPASVAPLAPPHGAVGLDAPPPPPAAMRPVAPPPGAVGLDAPPPGAFVPEQPSATRMRVRHRVPAGERVVQVVRRYVGVAAVVAAIVAAALLVPAAHHSGSPSGAPAASRSTVTAVVR